MSMKDIIEGNYKPEDRGGREGRDENEENGRKRKNLF